MGRTPGWAPGQDCVSSDSCSVSCFCEEWLRNKAYMWEGHLTVSDVCNLT